MGNVLNFYKNHPTLNTPPDPNLTGPFKISLDHGSPADQHFFYFLLLTAYFSTLPYTRVYSPLFLLERKNQTPPVRRE